MLYLLHGFTFDYMIIAFNRNCFSPNKLLARYEPIFLIETHFLLLVLFHIVTCCAGFPAATMLLGESDFMVISLK